MLIQPEAKGKPCCPSLIYCLDLELFKEEKERVKPHNTVASSVKHVLEIHRKADDVTMEGDCSDSP